MAVMYYGTDLTDRIIEFNRSSATCRIELKDYSVYNEAGSIVGGISGGVKQLNLDIISGKAPDILLCNDLPIEKYASKGLLEDLYPYLDADPELSPEDIVPAVRNALETNGHLYRFATVFRIETLVGRKSKAGPNMGRTLDEYMNCAYSMPKGTSPFYLNFKSDMLRQLLIYSMDSYVNWDTGELRFESEDFIKLLEYCSAFPSEQEYSEKN